jgi:hypothetical protein
MPRGPNGYSLLGPQLRLRSDLDIWRELNDPPIRRWPVDLLKTPGGVELVEQHLERLAFGVYT